MPDKDILIAKIGTIKRCLNRIKIVTELNPDKIDDYDKQDVFVLNLQRTVQACIDIANHIIAEDGLGVPDSIRQSFEILCENKIIDFEILDKMKKMVSFRNICVHEYRELDINILKSILKNNLTDIELYYKNIAAKFLTNE